MLDISSPLLNIGDSGRHCDSSVYANSNLSYAIENKQLKLAGEEKSRNSQNNSTTCVCR